MEQNDFISNVVCLLWNKMTLLVMLFILVTPHLINLQIQISEI